MVFSDQSLLIISRVVTLQTFALEKLDLLTVYLARETHFFKCDRFCPNTLGKFYNLEFGNFQNVCHRNNRVSVGSYPKAVARENSNPKLN